MTPDENDWDIEELPPENWDEVYASLARTLQRTQGFSLMFVQCLPEDADKIIGRVRADLPQKQIEVWQFDQAIDQLYKPVQELTQQQQIDILFIRGLEHSLYGYETSKSQSEWSDEERRSYSWKGVPPILAHLNLQRENFRDNLNLCLIFLVPYFVINYFIHRAPDFFDWRSGLFKFPTDSELLNQVDQGLLEDRDYSYYIRLTPTERHREFLEIQSLLANSNLTAEQQANLLFRQGVLYGFMEQYEQEVASYDQAVRLKTDFHQAFYNRGIALASLGRLEEALASYEQALTLKPDKQEAWISKGIVLRRLGQHQAALASYEQAIAINHDDPRAWYNRGIVLRNLGHYDKAIDSFSKAAQINPKYASALYNIACAYALLGDVKQAVASLQQAISLDPEKYLKMAQTDTDFATIRDEIEFKVLLENPLGHLAAS